MNLQQDQCKIIMIVNLKFISIFFRVGMGMIWEDDEVNKVRLYHLSLNHLSIKSIKYFNQLCSSFSMKAKLLLHNGIFQSIFHPILVYNATVAAQLCLLHCGNQKMQIWYVVIEKFRKLEPFLQFIINFSLHITPFQNNPRISE